MAANSKREQLILKNKAIVQGIPLFKTVKRVRPTYSDLEGFAQTQFPVAAIVGQIPVPVPKPNGMGISHDQFIMSLDIQIFAYLMVNEDADTAISSMVDDLWRELHKDQSRGKLAIETTVSPGRDIHLYAPFAGTLITVNHKYVTGVGGI